MNLTVSLIWKNDDEPDYFISVIEDISDRKHTEEALRINEMELEAYRQHLEELVALRTRELEAQERFVRSLVNNLPGMVGYWDENLRCRFANKSYFEWFGRTEKQMLGLTIQEVLGPEVFAKNECFIRGALLGEKQTFERSFVKPDGCIGHVLAHYLPEGGQTHAWPPAPLGVAAVANLRRIQGQGSRHRGRIRQPGLHQPDLLVLWRIGEALETSFRVPSLWSAGAQRLECKSEPCPHWRDRRLAKGGCKYA